jgi:hypothetical protein
MLINYIYLSLLLEYGGLSKILEDSERTGGLCYNSLRKNTKFNFLEKMTDKLKQIALDLGLEAADESKEDVKCLKELGRLQAKKGPITSLFYKIKESPEGYKVYFSADLLKDLKKDKKKYNVRYYTSFGYIETLSSSVMFEMELLEDGKTEAVVILGHELVRLDQEVQERMIPYLLEGNGNKLSERIKAIGPEGLTIYFR